LGVAQLMQPLLIGADHRALCGLVGHEASRRLWVCLTGRQPGQLSQIDSSCA
jgi:hypothetical protein